MTRRKSNVEHEHENSERWLVSYADFITLLFAFFVVMYATSTQNSEKEKKFESSIRESMRLPQSGGEGGAGGGSGASAAAAAASELGAASDTMMQTQGRLAGNADVQEKIEKSVQEKLGPENGQVVTSLRHDLFGVRMSLAASTVFPTGSAKMKREALPTLDKIAAILKQQPYKMLIEGHTDDQPIAEGSEFASNWELASARATQVVRYLVKVHGIPADKLAAVSYADQRPLTPNVDEESRAKNRRIEILFITGDSPYDEF